jgi:hypothetical protein
MFAEELFFDGRAPANCTEAVVISVVAAVVSAIAAGGALLAALN